MPRAGTAAATCAQLFLSPSLANALFCSPLKTYPRVALLIESSRTYGRGVLRGIANYAHIHGPWSIFSQERELHGGIPSWLKKWSGDGIIARIQSRRMARELARRGLPVVDVLGNEPYPGIPGFDTDSEAVARVTADFFIKAGFRELAFCGYRGIPFSDRREASLAAYLARLNRRLLVCSPRPKRLPPEDIQATEALGWPRNKPWPPGCKPSGGRWR